MNPVGELRAATAILTRIPSPIPAGSGPGAAAFPVIGGFLGLAAAVPVVALAGERWIGAVLAFAVLAVLTGALHLDGLADLADALAASDPEGAERARRDPSLGAAGVVAVILVLGTGVAAVAALPAEAAAAALIVAGSVSRAIPPVAAVVAPRRGTGFGAWFASGVRRRDAAVAALVAAAATGLAGWALPGAAIALAAGGMAGAIVGLGTIAVAWRRLGHVPGDAYGAGVELALVTTLVVAAVVRP